MVKEIINKLAARQNLSFEEAKEVFENIFTHKLSHSQIASFLTALTIKGETEEEIFAAATVIRQKATRISVKGEFIGMEFDDEPILDTCGTGGSGINKFNISTAVAFVIASCGIKVAKHGNRAMSSNCGSADVLDELGIKIDVNQNIMAESIKKIGIGFLYAPLYHPALKEVAGIRKELGIRTIFNILGPLCNPAFATHQVLGVYRKDLVKVIAMVLKKLALKKALVVHSKDLKDEVSLNGETTAALLDNKKIKYLSLHPSDFGLKKVNIKELEVKNVTQSAELIKEILNGKKNGPRDVVLANASCCLYVVGKVHNFKEGVRLAASLIDEGKAKNKLQEFKDFLQTPK